MTLIIGTNVYTFIVFDRASVLESFMLACGVLGLTMWIQRIDTIQGLVQTALGGDQGSHGGCSDPGPGLLHQHRERARSRPRPTWCPSPRTP